MRRPTQARSHEGETVTVNVLVAGFRPGSSVVRIRCSSLIVVSDCRSGGLGFNLFYRHAQRIRPCHNLSFP